MLAFNWHNLLLSILCCLPITYKNGRLFIPGVTHCDFDQVAAGVLRITTSSSSRVRLCVIGCRDIMYTPLLETCTLKMSFAMTTDSTVVLSTFLSHVVPAVHAVCLSDSDVWYATALPTRLDVGFESGF